MNLSTSATTFLNSTTAARTVTIVLLAALAGLTTHAVLKLAYGAPAPSNDPLPATMGDSAKPVPLWLTGGDNTLSAAASDIKLLGVVAQGNAGRQGYALLQITGKRAQVVQVGQTMADGTQLLRVQGKTAIVNIGGQQRILNLEAPSGSTATVNGAMPILTTPQVYNPSADAAAQQAQIAQAAQIQQLQQAAATQQGNAAAEPNSATPEAALNGQSRRRMGARP
jgi:hypothetical protein